MSSQAIRLATSANPATVVKIEINAARTARMRQIRMADQDHFERTRLRDLLKPTRETEAKLRPDPLERLFANKEITDAERDAGLEIRAIYFAVCGALMPRSGWPVDRQPGRSGGIPQWLAAIHADHWKPWADSLKRPCLEITIDAIVDERSFAELDAAWHWGHGKAKSLVVHSLQRYAALVEHA